MSDIWLVLAGQGSGGCCAAGHDLYLGCSSPAIQQRTSSAINGLTFLYLQLVSLFDPSLLLRGEEGRRGAPDNNSLTESLHFSLVKLTKKFPAKSHKMCNNSKKCPKSARKTDNMLGMALHGKNSCLHKKHNKKFSIEKNVHESLTNRAAYTNRLILHNYFFRYRLQY